MKKQQTEQTEWEKEFLKVWTESLFDSSNNRGDRVKKFIYDLLARHDEKIVEQLNRMKGKYQDCDFDDVQSVAAGYEEALDAAIGFLTPLKTEEKI